jgi:hypothetical protein
MCCVNSRGGHGRGVGLECLRLRPTGDTVTSGRARPDGMAYVVRERSRGAKLVWRGSPEGGAATAAGSVFSYYRSCVVMHALNQHFYVGFNLVSYFYLQVIEDIFIHALAAVLLLVVHGLYLG